MQCMGMKMEWYALNLTACMHGNLHPILMLQLHMHPPTTASTMDSMHIRTNVWLVKRCTNTCQNHALRCQFDPCTNRPSHTLLRFFGRGEGGGQQFSANLQCYDLGLLAPEWTYMRPSWAPT